MENFIVLKDVSKTIKKQKVLNQINLNLSKGKIYGFRGRNGSGKTMLFRAISGLITIDSGSLTVDSIEIGKTFSFPKSIGLLIESPGFIPEYTGFKNLKLLSMIKNEINDNQIKLALSQVGLNPEDRRKYKKYSLGMKQRLGIAQALMENPELIMLDEPTNALDEQGIEELNKLLVELRIQGATILIASHDYLTLKKVADEIFLLDDGKIISREGNE